jgi:16S rRNA (cytidine1402-2'-O)-methyltransferase
MAGCLFVVATPIGNLEDLTFRALRTLKEVDLIAAEDTRRTSKLLAHYQVSRPLVSLHEHNEHREAPKLVERLVAGESIALVSDAGTPGISDPGSTLVRLARLRGVKVVPVPGPSALTAALSVSGLALPSFVFLGFPPASGAARERWFEGLSQEPRVAVFFEAPHRIARALTETADYCVGRPITYTREISKIHEELVEWDIAKQREASAEFRGEFVVIVGAIEPAEPSAGDAESDGRAVDLFWQLTILSGLPDEKATIAVSALAGVSGVRLKKLVKQARIQRKRSRDAEQHESPEP